MIRVQKAQLSFLDHTYGSVIAFAEVVLREIGDDWEASKRELQRLDFKETPDTALPPEVRAKRNLGKARKEFLAMVAETASCLANAQGGVIILGVKDKAPTREAAIQGVPSAYTPEGVRLAVYDGTSPPLTVVVQERAVDGKRLLLVDVPVGAVVHATTGGAYKWRVEDRCEPIGPDTMRSISAARGVYDWSGERSEFGPDALSAAALAAAADRLRDAGHDELARQAEEDREQFLRSCELLDQGRVTRAGVLLYGSERALTGLVLDWGALVTTALSPGSEGTVLLRRDDARRRSLVLLIDDILARLAGVAQADAFRVGAAEVRLVDFEPDVVRELVANAFAHRDWEQPGMIEVAHSPDALLVASPGDLLPTLHADRLLRESAQRNRVLSREITRLRIAEGAGMGFDRVYRALAAAGKEPPRIEVGPRFTVVVPGGRGDRAFARFLRSDDFPEPRLSGDLDVLLTLSILRTRSSVTAAIVAPVIQRDVDFADDVLRRMHTAGLIDPTRSTASRRRPSYRLSVATAAALRPALQYRTGTIDIDDAKLLRHLKRHRRIANEDVRNYLECDVATARNRLTRLRKKGYITIDPDGPKRGPLVEYVATNTVDDSDD
ncbi:RNA-binding domain-containing protein [Baekduia sp. Peel2402]|uniref:RNA-binding domain-containing protein n=1 Tax=Baekduia sp. Peel2402 TaxID=3458296 RepID=UPI00403E9427